ncbi:phosphatase PAP2 family protein [Pilimelia columellifera]|uniref:Phosphatidic acid phosphatase type 2/haloperoxidase domain-containing protein n=1 Tax=Pilimelia columellifera subsp. columellifera TaxID=706583 RepID=A0ABN3NFQ7_9ACTN
MVRWVRPAGVWWWVAQVALLAAVAALTGALAAGSLLDLDVAVRNWIWDHRPPAVFNVATVLNYLGQGGWVLLPLATLLAAALARRTRSVRPLLPVAGAFLVTGLTIGPMKLLLDRGFPGNDKLAHPERLFSDPIRGLAYPSGHAANAVVWYGVIALLVAGLFRAAGRELPAEAGWLIRVVPPLVVVCTTTLLTHHWLTDAVAGVLLGVFLDGLLRRVDWDAVPLPARLGPWRGSANLS